MKMKLFFLALTLPTGGESWQRETYLKCPEYLGHGWCIPEWEHESTPSLFSNLLCVINDVVDVTVCHRRRKNVIVRLWDTDGTFCTLKLSVCDGIKLGVFYQASLSPWRAVLEVKTLQILNIESYNFSSQCTVQTFLSQINFIQRLFLPDSMCSTSLSYFFWMLLCYQNWRKKISSCYQWLIETFFSAKFAFLQQVQCR